MYDDINCKKFPGLSACHISKVETIANSIIMLSHLLRGLLDGFLATPIKHLKINTRPLKTKVRRLLLLLA